MSMIAIVCFFILAFMGMPLSFALGLASLIVLVLADFEMVVLAQRMMYAVDNFPLMAIPLFILAGEIMVKAEMMERLVSFSNSLVGRVHGWFSPRHHPVRDDFSGRQWRSSGLCQCVG